MTIRFGVGACPRHARGLLAGAAIVSAAIWASHPGAEAAKRQSIDFQGELNYETFKNAASRGVGVRITYSPGGTGAAAMVLGRSRGLVIDGTCDSACAWAFVRNPHACFTSRASFGFHGAHDPGTGRRLTAATDYWLSTVRPALRPRLSGLRTSSKVIRVSAREMSRHYGDRQCGAVSAAASAPSEAEETKAGRPDLAPSSAESEAAPATGADLGPRPIDGIERQSLCLVCEILPSLALDFASSAGTGALWDLAIRYEDTLPAGERADGNDSGAT